jgi:hypothetical protein
MAIDSRDSWSATPEHTSVFSQFNAIPEFLQRVQQFHKKSQHCPARNLWKTHWPLAKLLLNAITSEAGYWLLSASTRYAPCPPFTPQIHFI